MTTRGAVFLDRDGTIIRDPGYLHDPDQVALLPRAAEGLATMAAAGWPLVVVTNQSGIGRGLFTEADYLAVMRRLDSQLARHGIRLLASYFCPHFPERDGPCDCRKPGTQLFRRAAAEHQLVPGDSWFIGDRWRDVAPALSLGGRGILVGADPLSDDAAAAARHAIPLAPDLAAAAGIVGARS